MTFVDRTIVIGLGVDASVSRFDFTCMSRKKPTRACRCCYVAMAAAGTIFVRVNTVSYRANSADPVSLC